MPLIDQIGDDQSLLGDRHGAGEGHDDEAILVTRHGLQHVGGLPDLASGEGGLRHGAHQVVDRADPWKIERLQRDQLIADGVVQLALDARAFRIVFMIAVLHVLTSLLLVIAVNGATGKML